MSEETEIVHRLSRSFVPEVVDVLCDSFFDYPVMRFVLGDAENKYTVHLRTLLHFFVMARVFRREILLGIGNVGDLRATALVSFTSRGESSAELDDLRERVWAELGTAARSRYEAFGAACTSFERESPHVHLNMIGVRRLARGEGLSRRLIEYVQRLSQADPGSEGVTLTTEDEANVQLYEHLGYRLVGHETVAPELSTWGFFKPD